jgi:predicted phosphodiesterase
LPLRQPAVILKLPRFFCFFLLFQLNRTGGKKITPLAGLKYRLNTSLQRKKRLFSALEITATLAGLIFAVVFLGPAEYNLGGVDVRVALAPASQGRTVVELPPLGALAAKTHLPPLEIRLLLKNIRPAELFRHDFDLSSPGSALEGFIPAAKRAALLFALREILLGGCGAALALLLFFRAGLKRCLLGAAAGMAFLAAVFTATGLTYTVKGIREPEYSGLIALAPQMLALAQENGKEISGFKEKAKELAGNFQQLLAQIDRLSYRPSSGPEAVKLLAVSDLHNNPLGVDLTLALAGQFNVDAVLDAGDLTDYGSPLEAKIVNSLKRLAVPYVFAAGNHDRAAVISFVKSLPEGRPLEGKTVEVKGLRILGSPDPLAFRRSPADVTPDGSLLNRQVTDLEEALRKEEAPPDLLLVHNPDVARAFAGRIPVLVSGHTHRQEVEKIKGSIYINPGTTGAAGIRGLAAPAGPRRTVYSAAILYFSPPLPGGGKRSSFSLTAVDLVNFDPLSGKFGVERQLFPSE